MSQEWAEKELAGMDLCDARLNKRSVRFCRVSMPKTGAAGCDMAPLLWTDLSCERIKLLGKRHAIAAHHVELAFANHVHKFDSGQDGLRRSERFKPELWPGNAFNGTMILLDDIVEILDLPDLDRDFSLRI